MKEGKPSPDALRNYSRVIEVTRAFVNVTGTVVIGSGLAIFLGSIASPEGTTVIETLQKFPQLFAPSFLGGFAAARLASNRLAVALSPNTPTESENPENKI